jgi:hypothetical protein
VDWYLVLTPLVGLAVIALLGFSGCDLVFPLHPPDGNLTLELRVPSTLAVLEARFQWTEPGSTTVTTATDLVTTTEGDTTVLSRLVGPLIEGIWQVSCRLGVQDASEQQDTDNGDGMFAVESLDDDSTATFEATGTPATNNFKVLFVGLATE